MHRLLLYKGYVFPEIRTEDAAVLNPSDVWSPIPVLLCIVVSDGGLQNLRSAEEMEEEEREAQSAKLQELIRRGTPADLQEANRLMKIMAGYDNRHKTDYRAKAAEEVAKVQQKAKLLEEMLQSQQPGETVAEGDVFEVRCMLYVGKLFAQRFDRNSPMRCGAHIPKSKECARKRAMIRKQSISCWKSTTAYTARLNDTD